MTRIVAGPLLGLPWLAVSGSANAQEDAISWSFTPYVWAANTSIDLKWRDVAVGGGDIDFGELVNSLEAAAMFQLEAGRAHWSTFLDLTYLATSDSKSVDPIDVDVDSKQYFIDLAASFWPQALGDGFNLFAGVRYTRFENDLGASVGGSPLGDRKSNQNFTDVLAGVRYVGEFTNRWGYVLRADGSVGDSEGTWLLRATATYDVGQIDRNQLIFGYQLKSAKFDDREFVTDYSYAGLTVGFQFQF